MNKFLLLLPLLSACTVTQQIATQTGFQSQAERKQKQRVILLQKKLLARERDLLEEKKEVESLHYQLHDAELDLIEMQLEHFEEKWQSDPARLVQLLRKSNLDLFIEEREVLYRCIQTGPSVPRAQFLLDRILQLITQVSDFNR